MWLFALLFVEQVFRRYFMYKFLSLIIVVNYKVNRETYNFIKAWRNSWSSFFKGININYEMVIFINFRQAAKTNTLLFHYSSCYWYRTQINFRCFYIMLLLMLFVRSPLSGKQITVRLSVCGLATLFLQTLK